MVWRRGSIRQRRRRGRQRGREVAVRPLGRGFGTDLGCEILGDTGDGVVGVRDFQGKFGDLALGIAPELSVSSRSLRRSSARAAVTCSMRSSVVMRRVSAELDMLGSLQVSGLQPGASGSEIGIGLKLGLALFRIPDQSCNPLIAGGRTGSKGLGDGSQAGELSSI